MLAGDDGLGAEKGWYCTRISMPGVRDAANAFISADLSRLDREVYTPLAMKYSSIADYISRKRAGKDYVEAMRRHYLKLSPYVQPDESGRELPDRKVGLAQKPIGRLALGFFKYADIWYQVHASLGEVLVEASRKKSDLERMVHNIALSDAALNKVHPTPLDAMAYHREEENFLDAQASYWAQRPGGMPLFRDYVALQALQQRMYEYRKNEWDRRYSEPWATAISQLL